MNDVERLEAIEELLDELSSLSTTHIILVEGLKDVVSLKAVGVEGEFFCVQSGGGPVKAAEHVWHSGKQAVIMTDWDRRGGTLAKALRENLSSLDVRYDDRIRGELVVLCRPYVKDVESIDAVVRLLKGLTGMQAGNPYLGTTYAVGMNGAFVVIEGIDGAGKSTVCRRVSEKLASRGIEVVLTAEPTHEGIGAFIRSGAAGLVSQRTEALLFVADRNDHTERIMADVAAGRVVVCDRYFASTVAYQSAWLNGDGTDRDWLILINSDFTGVPDVTVLLDIDPATGMARAGFRGEEVSKFEEERFLTQVRANYLRLANEFGFTVVDASADPDRVLAEVMAIIDGVV